MSAGDDWRQTFRPDIPSPARMYNYFLGGKDHYEADRKAADQVIAAIPEVLVFARENRAFLRRAVRYLVTQCGIRQIIDVGTGLPSEGNVHEVAQTYDPGVRVVYVDHDPVVLAHGRNMLNGVPGTTIIGRDLPAGRSRGGGADLPRDDHQHPRPDAFSGPFVFGGRPRVGRTRPGVGSAVAAVTRDRATRTGPG